MDAQIRKRFTDLIEEGAVLYDRLLQENHLAYERSAARGVVRVGGHFGCLPSEYESYRTRALNLIEHVGASSRFADEIRAGDGRPSDAAKILGILKGLDDDYRSGILDRIVHRIEAELASDLVRQAARLLSEGQSIVHDHVPAAVLLGAILERSLKTLCLRQTPAVAVTKPNGDKLMMNALIEELKKANVYQETKAAQLRAWASIRNAAAHGEFTKFTKADVEGMQHGVMNFLADYL